MFKLLNNRNILQLVTYENISINYFYAIIMQVLMLKSTYHINKQTT